jgi:hypothetical protein
VAVAVHLPADRYLGVPGRQGRRDALGDPLLDQERNNSRRVPDLRADATKPVGRRLVLLVRCVLVL